MTRVDLLTTLLDLRFDGPVSYESGISQKRMLTIAASEIIADALLALVADPRMREARS